MSDMADSPTTRREVAIDPRVDAHDLDNQKYQNSGDPAYLSGDARKARDERVER
jgi:hypothetical protein